MLSKNIGAYVKFAEGLAINTSQAATVTGTGVDRRGFNSCVLRGKLGAVSGTPDATSAIIKLQQSSDDGSADAYADISGATMTLTAANDVDYADVNLDGCERYIRAVLVLTFTNGSTPSTYYTADILLGGADSLPQS